MMYHIETACDQGVVRSNNEDAICYDHNKKVDVLWMLIADGVGGHKAGEVASEYLINYFDHAFSQLTQSPEQGWLPWIEEHFTLVNEGIFKQSQAESSHQGMSTTGVLLVIDSKQCYLGWVGDSRAYSLSESVLKQQTKDHTMIQYLLDKGAITAEEAQKSNTKNLLAKAIGTKETIEVDVLSFGVKVGDTLLLSTDGLHDYLTTEQLALFMKNSNTTQSVCSDMIAQSINQSSKDNITVGIIKIY